MNFWKSIKSSLGLTPIVPKQQDIRPAVIKDPDMWLETTYEGVARHYCRDPYRLLKANDFHKEYLDQLEQFRLDVQSTKGCVTIDVKRSFDSVTVKYTDIFDDALIDRMNAAITTIKPLPHIGEAKWLRDQNYNAKRRLKRLRGY